MLYCMAIEMKTLILPLLQALIGIALVLFGVVCACSGGYGFIAGWILGIVGLLVCITAYLRAKALLEENEEKHN